ncbi:23S rRNA (adenine(2030)-N(6))-methyltransferase RlmJ [Shewanella sp. MMG014]|uniref:23S rRNA (adenine(2030)-N(6))-methyltransferase RlmJ n=1 Tax=Shewanella sp. MMG014 TaxID=2822691 RepID=UPI001B361D9C|nr:23S rRNA (adenine(2030)-N(6))-methyltransferase RlmJ [Shewanella sp. MMG014]MBQ4890302.1 23S rRNA (adenine(2030)-N(6))-methyltransferase RlmJ [Shewanella sp. MMG014]
MLSYRHGYHAGNYADVLKHTMLLQVLKLMHKKHKPMAYIDSHAGAGGYALTDEFSKKTGEYLDGVAKLWGKDDLPEPLQQYVDDVKHFNQGEEELAFYPGSPAFVDMNMREKDRMVLHELHGTDFASLDEQFSNDRHIRVVKGDGLKGLIAAVPPLERRGVALIDPSYEIKTDYQDVANAIIKAHKRFATGVYMLWYPVVDRAQTEAMLKILADSGIKNQLRIEQSITPDSDAFGMTAAGLWIINPPWQLDIAAKETLDYLERCLGQSGGKTVVKLEVPE